MGDDGLVGSSIVMESGEGSIPLARRSAFRASTNSSRFRIGIGHLLLRTDAVGESQKKKPSEYGELCRTPLPLVGRVVSSGHLQRRRLPDRVMGLRASPTARYAIKLTALYHVHVAAHGRTRPLVTYHRLECVGELTYGW